MKILFLTNHINIGGITVYLLNLCKALHGKDDIEIMVASRGGDAEESFKALGVKLITLPLTTKCEVSPKVFISFFKLKKIIQKEGIDIIHANTRVTQVLAELLSHAAKKPYISTCHGYFKPRLSRRLFPCWGKRVIAISDQVRSHLISDFRLSDERIKVISNGIDLAKFHAFDLNVIVNEKKRLGLDPDKKIIGHIGRLSSVKGQKFFVQAAELILRTRSDMQFVIFGDGKEKSNLEKLIEELKIGKSFFLYPTVLDTALSLSIMDIFVMPSLEEGLGLSILEAQAQGVPVVASRVGGIPSIVSDKVTGILVESKSAQALADAIVSIDADVRLRSAFVKNSKEQVVNKFSSQLMSAKTREVYQEVLSEAF